MKKVLHKSVLLKEIKDESTGLIPGVNEIDHVEVAYKSDDVTCVDIGDTVIYQNSSGRIKVGGGEYILVSEENIKVVL